jgi:hypothetical protein
MTPSVLFSTLDVHPRTSSSMASKQAAPSFSRVLAIWPSTTLHLNNSRRNILSSSRCKQVRLVSFHHGHSKLIRKEHLGSSK